MLAWMTRLVAVLATAAGWAAMVVIPATAGTVAVGAFVLYDPMRVAIHAAAATSLGGAGIFILCWLRHRLTPTRWRVRRLFPGSREVSRGLWQSPERGIQAFAVAGLGRGAVILSTGIASLPTEEQRWIHAHEQSHLRRGDAAASLWWLAGVDLMRLDRVIASGLYRVFRRIPLVRRAAWLYFRLASLALRFALVLFRASDRLIGQHKEYRADRDAAKVATPGVGIRVLYRLTTGLEPTFGLFATHPPTRKRIEQQEALCQG